MSKTQELILELPTEGALSWNTIDRCAREAGMSSEDWLADAIAAYVRMHQREIAARQREQWPLPPQEKRPVARWKLDLGERLLRWGERLTDDGTEY